MKTIGDPAVLSALASRLQRLTLAHERVWGSISAHQMVSHARRRFRSRARAPAFFAGHQTAHRLMKVVALSLPMRWPRGIKSGADPPAKVLPVPEFPADLDRAIGSLRQLAETGSGLAERHPIFGAMSAADWHRWAYLVTPIITFDKMTWPSRSTPRHPLSFHAKPEGSTTSDAPWGPSG